MSLPALYPFKFRPIFKERVWGGRELGRLFNKLLPSDAPIGESWEISDRPGDSSLISNGPLAGRDLRWLMTERAEELLGTAKSQHGRFPLLIKILDAREKLSLQVHPPPHKAAELGGEPKTEMWFIADAAPGAELYVGLKRGVDRAQFECKVRDGSVADCFHRIAVRAGDVMFLPSGRVHAIGAGLVIFEIQQNSDTTYRVFDWNRAGLDGQPRELHVAQSLASIDFTDFEPELARGESVANENFSVRRLVQNELFTTELFETRVARKLTAPKECMEIIGVVEGKLSLTDPYNNISVGLEAGDFCLIPAAVKTIELVSEPSTRFLRVEAH